jgi:hypothetical protein
MPEYCEGYFLYAREAAIALRLQKGANRSAMPILFLYRHYLEIALKYALHRSRAFDLSQSEEKFRHDLAALWAETKRVLSAFKPEEWLTPIGQAIDVFNAVDLRADAFRYATKPEGDPRMPKDAHVVYHELIEQMDNMRAAIDLATEEIRLREAKLGISSRQ